jgi:uncharacterized membrane protein YkvA (DUF1232 family)
VNDAGEEPVKKEPRPIVERHEPAFVTRFKQRSQRLQNEAQVFYYAFKHPRVRWPARLVAAFTVGYQFSPIQLIPNFIPVIGFADNFLVIFIGVKLLRKLISPEILAECRAKAAASQVRRKEEIRSATGRVAFVVIVALLILGTIGSGVLMAACFRH